ncbi:MAG: acyltransferase, partial [Gemmatimonadales bacterium]
AVGPHLRLGRGACIVGRQVTVGAGVSIGKGASITCDHIEIEDGVMIGAGVTIRCRRLVLRSRARIDHSTTIYGLVTPNSGLEMGADSWLYSYCHVSTDEMVRIGARSAAGSHSLIFTHSSYLPITNGYPVTFAPVTIGEEVWLPWHVFVLPGATIGDGATVGAMSLVGGSIPPRSLAVGVPAKVIKDEASYRRSYDPAQLEALGRRVLADVLRNFAGTFRPRHLFFPPRVQVDELSSDAWSLRSGKESLEVRWLQEASSPSMQTPILLVTVGRDSAPDGRCWWVDLSTLRAQYPADAPPILAAFLEHFSVFGIRFGWRHPVVEPQSAPRAARE